MKGFKFLLMCFFSFVLLNFSTESKAEINRTDYEIVSIYEVPCIDISNNVDNLEIQNLIQKESKALIINQESKVDYPKFWPINNHKTISIKNNKYKRKITPDLKGYNQLVFSMKA